MMLTWVGWIASFLLIGSIYPELLREIERRDTRHVWQFHVIQLVAACLCALALGWRMK